jgi:16S rRNA (guanine527-N7)-methyltransferase
MPAGRASILPPDNVGRDAFLAACPVSRETLARLERYEQLLIACNQRLSLVSKSTLPLIWTRHFLDSAQLARLIPNPNSTVVDLGSGAGFPGLVLAILGLPRIHLVEHNLQKVAFLRSVVAALALPVTIHAMKSQAIKPFQAGAITARALKPLSELLTLAVRFVGPDTICVFPKGRRADEEWGAAQARWRMTTERFPSLTDPDSTILRLSHLSEIRA